MDPTLLSPDSLARALRLESARCKREGTRLQAILVDLDDFGELNAALGQAGGDAVLDTIGVRLATALRGCDHLGRLPGDRFVVLLPSTRDAEARRVAEKLRRILADAPIRTNGRAVPVTATLGIAEIGEDAATVEAFLEQAEPAVTRGKAAGKNRVATSGRKGRSATDLQHLGELLDGHEPLRVVRQGLYAVGDEHVCGYELLVRGPRGPLEDPTALFAAAADADLLSSVDLRCVRALGEALSGLSIAQRAHLNLLPSTILATPVDRLLSILPSRMVCIEVSEQELVGDPAEIKGAIEELRAGGVEIALDDVGFSRSSLEALAVIAPDVVKIGRRHVSGVGEDPARQRELARLVSAARQASRQIIAVGVETRRDLDVVRDLGVPFAQGFLWGRPG